MKAYTYIIVRKNKDQGPRFYFGYKTIRADRGNYYGSSKLLRADIQKYGIHNFKKTIVRYFDTAEQALQSEEEYLKKVDAANNPLFYNRINGSRKWTTINFSVTPDTHPKNFYRGDQRTEAQKLGMKKRYANGRSEARLRADREHSERMKGRPLPAIAIQRSQESFQKNKIAIVEKMRACKLGKTKKNDAGRRATAEKMKNNRNCITGAVRLANMSEEEFLHYCASRCQKPHIQKMLHTRRKKGFEYIKTGVYNEHARCNKYVYFTPHGIFFRAIDITRATHIPLQDALKKFNIDSIDWYKVDRRDITLSEDLDYNALHQGAS